MGNPGIERRIHPRQDTSLPVRISTIDAETDRRSRAPFFRASREWSANVSRGGVFVRTSEPLAMGRRVLVELTLPDGRCIDSVGRVAWVQRRIPGGEEPTAEGIGIEFLGAAPDDLLALERFLRTQRSDGVAAHGYLV